MTNEKEIKILEVFEGDYGIEVTDSNLKIKTGPLFDPFLRMIPISRYTGTRRMPRTIVIEEIPLKNIHTIKINGKSIKITWIKKSKQSLYKMKETKIRMKPFKSKLIREAISRLMKGEDPEKLAIEYSKALSTYFKKFQDDRNVILLKGDYIEIYSKEIYEIISGRIPLISRSSLFLQALASYSEKIPINKISNIEMEKISENKIKVKIELKEKKRRTLIFKNEKEAKNLIETVRKIMKVHGKEKEKTIITTKGQLILGSRIKEKEEWKRKILENFTKFLMLFTTIYIIFSEFYGKSITLALITILISLITLILWNKLRE